jgi:alkaline phosphatase D
VIFISGDRHFAELSVLRRPDLFPLYEVTSSALNLRHPSGLTGSNEFRIGGTYLRENFGEIRIRWSTDTEISLSVRDLAGDVRLETSFRLSDLFTAVR